VTQTLSEGKLSLVYGITSYLYPRAKESNGFYKVTYEPNLALNWTAGALTLTPKVYYDMTMHGLTYEANAAYVAQLGTEVDFSATIGTYKWYRAVQNSIPDTKGTGDYFSI